MFLIHPKMLLRYSARFQIKHSIYIKFSLSEYSTINASPLRTNEGLLRNSNRNNIRNFTGFSNHERLTFWRRQIEKDKFPVLGNLYASHISCSKTVEMDQSFKKDLESLAILFPNPKNTIHSFFDTVASELQTPGYRITPSYKATPMRINSKLTEWTCTYSMKWPQELKFNGTALTKRDASNKAACKVLLHLLKSGKILKNGTPVIYDKETVKKVIHESTFSVKLSKTQLQCLDDMHDIFETKLKPQLENNDLSNFKLSEIDNSDLNSDLNIMRKWAVNRRKLNRNLSLYTAKESVKLPIQEHRADFERLLSDNQVVIIRGEPGCGKSTRIPQYALEHWVKNVGTEPCNVIVTQPRRIAAISLAERVADERNERVGDIVGYQVRLKSAFNPNTGCILYCTTGILLRQIQSDPNLSHCTHIILDEAHERDVNTDLLMNLVRQALAKNKNLRLIIMSATIDVSLFQDYFDGAPVMDIPGFTYPVVVNFLDDININLTRTKDICNGSRVSIAFEEVAKVIKWIHTSKPEGAILCFLPGWEDISKVSKLLDITLDSQCLIVAVHSKLSNDEQRKIFSKPPQGVRKIILATNIAETSVTVDDVVYVVDSGIQKESRFDVHKGVMSIDNHWISQANMKQRKGRAGRVQAGESFHLYPKEKWRQMPEYAVPEILRVGLTKIVLDAKVYSNNMDAKDFFAQLPCPPTDDTVRIAVEELQDLEMLDYKENMTPLGRVVSDFQLAPKLSKAMIHSVIYKCVIPIVDIATLFSSDARIFANLLTDKEAIRITKRKFSRDSDHIASMILFEQWANFIDNEDYHEAIRYCKLHNLMPYKLNTIKKLKDIHYNYLAQYLQNVLELSDEYSTNKEFIKGVLLSGVGTVLLHRNWDIVRGHMKRANVFLTGHKQKATILQDSVNYKIPKYDTPFFVYINEIRSEMRRITLIHETSVIQPLTFILFKNSELLFHKIYDNNTEFDDPVLISLAGTTFKMLCDREQALLIKKCKNALKQMEKYFIYQLTKGGEAQPEMVQNWEQMLCLLNELLKIK